MRHGGAIFGALSVAPFVVLACAGEAPSPKIAVVASPASGVAPPISLSATTSASSLPAPVASASVATAAQSPALSWLSLLAPRPVMAKKDEFVWATVPTDKGVRFGVYRVLSNDGDSASLLDMLRVRWDHVPGALIYPVVWNEMAALKKDDRVTYADWRGFVGIAMVTATVPKLRVTFRDASSVVREEMANVAQKLVDEVAPLAWVMFPRDAERTAKGIVFAVAADRVLVRDDNDQAIVLPRDRVRVLPVPRAPLKPGDAVLAYSPDDGYRQGLVRRELLPKLAYTVDVGGESRSCFFSDLAISP